MVDRERARQYGLSAREVARVVSAAARGIRLRTFRDESGEVDMWLRFQDQDRQSVEQLGNIPVSGDGIDSPLRLASLVDFRISKGPRAIFRHNRTTSLGVSANLGDITMNEARTRIGAVMENFDFPPGYSWNYGESFDHEQEAMNAMLLNILLALALIYFVMASLFESLVFPAAMWTQILFSIVGVYWFFLISGTTMTVMAMIGILILIGVVVNNGIVLVDHINNLRDRFPTRREAIVQAGKDRMRPILMTAATTVLSLVPLCVVQTRVGGPGGPPYYPMARAIVGGLTFATMVTLLILPTIYCLLDDLRLWARYVVRRSDPQ
ncbi:MAG: MMPL family transporter [Candidatus Latescibacteria bacterium]|nr:MMPL family transporter [Candidatus Latescibacterota bacterium]